MALTDQEKVDDAVDAVYAAHLAIAECVTAGIDVLVTQKTKTSDGTILTAGVILTEIAVASAEKVSDITIKTPTPPA